MHLEGLHLPLTTPFFPDGRLNLRKLEQNVARYSLTPASGMVVLGRGGEAKLLTDEESWEVLRTAIRAAAAAKVMFAGVSRDGVSATLEMIEKAASLGYDVVVVEPPSFAGITGMEQRLFVQCVADRSPVPILLTGGIPVEILLELASHPNLIGYLHDFTTVEELEFLLRGTAAVRRSATVTSVFTAVTGRMQAAQTVQQSGPILSLDSLAGGGAVLVAASPQARLKTRTKEVGFQILLGGTERMLPGLLAGAVGAVPLLAAAAPQACHEVMAAWKDGDTALAQEKQLRLVEAVHGVETELGVAGIKFACDLNGYFGGGPRLPMLPLLGDQKAEVERLMQALRS